MTNESHTPGPWTVLDGGERGFDIAHDDGRGRVVANTDNVDMTDECNARLIAAAPDLLDALQEAIIQLRTFFPTYESIDPLSRYVEAVAKATGR